MAHLEGEIKGNSLSEVVFECYEVPGHTASWYFDSETRMILALFEKKQVSPLMMQKKVNMKVIATETYQMDTHLMDKIVILKSMIGMNMIVQNQQLM